jgi:hypothetical protein
MPVLIKCIQYVLKGLEMAMIEDRGILSGSGPHDTEFAAK